MGINVKMKKRTSRILSIIDWSRRIFKIFSAEGYFRFNEDVALKGWWRVWEGQMKARFQMALPSFSSVLLSSSTIFVKSIFHLLRKFSNSWWIRLCRNNWVSSRHPACRSSSGHTRSYTAAGNRRHVRPGSARADGACGSRPGRSPDRPNTEPA